MGVVPLCSNDGCGRKGSFTQNVKIGFDGNSLERIVYRWFIKLDWCEHLCRTCFASVLMVGVVGKMGGGVGLAMGDFETTPPGYSRVGLVK